MVIRKVGPWKVMDDTVVFENPWIRINDLAVTLPNGDPGNYGVVHFKNYAIGVLAIDCDGRIPIVGQHRFPLDAYRWELPEGGGSRGISPLASAKRELKEETGFTAEKWKLLAKFDLSNSVTDEQAICFLAWDLTPGLQSPDPSEDLELDKVDFNTLYQRVVSGDIQDSITIIMVLKTAALLEDGALPQDLAALLQCHDNG
ncbi:MAG: NUDIX hydrolase [Pseudomonadota bacterium]